MRSARISWDWCVHTSENLDLLQFEVVKFNEIELFKD